MRTCCTPLHYSYCLYLLNQILSLSSFLLHKSLPVETHSILMFLRHRWRMTNLQYSLIPSLPPCFHIYLSWFFWLNLWPAFLNCLLPHFSHHAPMLRIVPRYLNSSTSIFSLLSSLSHTLSPYFLPYNLHWHISCTHDLASDF